MKCAFRGIKRKFGFGKVRYGDMKKDTAQLKTLFTLSNLWMARTKLMALAKMRCRIERDSKDLKQELGLGHYEGRDWRRLYHHASLSIAAYGFLMERQLRHPGGTGKKTPHDAKNLPYPRITSLAAAQRTQCPVPSVITILRLLIAAALLATLPRCPCCLRVNAGFRL